MRLLVVRGVVEIARTRAVGLQEREIPYISAVNRGREQRRIRLHYVGNTVVSLLDLQRLDLDGTAIDSARRRDGIRDRRPCRKINAVERVVLDTLARRHDAVTRGDGAVRSITIVRRVGRGTCRQAVRVDVVRLRDRQRDIVPRRIAAGRRMDNLVRAQDIVLRREDGRRTVVGLLHLNFRTRIFVVETKLIAHSCRPMRTDKILLPDLAARIEQPVLRLADTVGGTLPEHAPRLVRHIVVLGIRTCECEITVDKSRPRIGILCIRAGILGVCAGTHIDGLRRAVRAAVAVRPCDRTAADIAAVGIARNLLILCKVDSRSHPRPMRITRHLRELRRTVVCHIRRGGRICNVHGNGTLHDGAAQITEIDVVVHLIGTVQCDGDVLDLEVFADIATQRRPIALVIISSAHTHISVKLARISGKAHLIVSNSILECRICCGGLVPHLPDFINCNFFLFHRNIAADDVIAEGIGKEQRSRARIDCAFLIIQGAGIYIGIYRCDLAPI